MNKPFPFIILKLCRPAVYEVTVCAGKKKLRNSVNLCAKILIPFQDQRL